MAPTSIPASALSSAASRTRGDGRRPHELTPPLEDLLSFAAPSDVLNSSVPTHGQHQQRAKLYSFEGCNCRRKQFCWVGGQSPILLL